MPPFQRQFIKSSTISKTIVLVLLSILTTLELGCSSDTEPSPPVTATVEPLSDSKIAQIETFCGDCHHLPSPSSFPKTRWAQEVFQGFAFYEDSNRTDMVEPIRMDTVRYFVERAPVQVGVPRSDSFAESPTSVKFEEGGLEGERFLVPTTSNIQLDSKSKSIFFTNMGEGELRQISIDGIGKGKSNLIATGKNICRAYLCDWDGDSKQDYLLSEIGGLEVADHHKGRVSLKLGDSDPIVLAENLSRVIDAKTLDWDQDGDLDILVADFGWLKTGSLLLLKNNGGSPNSPQFEKVVLDDRHGVLGIEIADMDSDGQLDYVVMYGQEFESIEIFYNRGKGSYEKKKIASLKDPSYNSSSFQIVDLDGDGKLDVVYTCGDAMDNFLAKPYHGVGWVRNQGDCDFEHRWIGLHVGALGSAAGDLDGDGDLDLVTVGMFPTPLEYGPGAYDSICWWEQIGDLQFVRHSVEQDRTTYTSVALADINDDGRVDILAGVWQVVDEQAFRVFENKQNWIKLK